MSLRRARPSSSKFACKWSRRSSPMLPDLTLIQSRYEVRPTRCSTYKWLTLEFLSGFGLKYDPDHPDALGQINFELNFSRIITT
ncbi:hypothetical protein JCGZ_22174 [Jatropha curcas]|uniref:Uncharacterized protein n=1 Tax=Jatropha curcas TaxID=180498 RepID=A0A067L846_JATCU|nr:hypothetical protein JCGZ_22174 [Jatropha curcas]